jgi:hypothetical protein
VARRTKRVTIIAEGRDKGKVYELTEMPADQGERWATRAILALANAGAKLPDGALATGTAGLEMSWRNVLVTGIQAMQGLTEPSVRPLLDELKPCMSYVPPQPGVPTQPIFPGENSQVEDFQTWYTLYFEYLQLHLGFSLAGMLSTSESQDPQASPAS